MGRIEIEKLIKENNILKEQLKEKQKQINKTNAFWKKKYYKK